MMIILNGTALEGTLLALSWLLPRRAEENKTISQP
jgi:hypothetical protein